MSIFKILHNAVRLMSMRGFTRFTGTAGYIHVSAGKDGQASDKEEAPCADDRGKGQNDIETILLDKFSQLTSDDQAAILRFVEYAANPDTHAHSGSEVEDWLDEQARMYTQDDANP